MCAAAVPVTEERQTLLREGGRSSVPSDERHTLVREGMREGRNSRAAPPPQEPVRAQ